jgi:DNA-binding transcriptional LysR family regulator
VRTAGPDTNPRARTGAAGVTPKGAHLHDGGCARIKMITLHQLRIFWAVAHAESLTRASKLLGLAQPSLSQQIAKLEESIGTQLFDRNRNQLQLTDAGKFLLRKSELILASVDEAMAGLQEFTEGARGVISVGALNSIARVILPRAMRRMSKVFPSVELDVHEVSPGEALELLYGRRLTVALVAEESIAKSNVSFRRFEVFSDPYVLAVPKGIDLAKVNDSWGDLGDAERKVLNSAIQFSFGTAHQRRMEEWFQHNLPHHRVVTQVRTYEVALSLVQEGLGVAVVPALTARLGSALDFGVQLYKVDLADRHIIGLIPSQYARVEPYATFIASLEQAGAEVDVPAVLPQPPFVRSAGVERNATAKVV